MNGRQSLRSALGVSFVAAAAFIFWMLITTTVEKITFSSGRTLAFGLLSSLISELECKSVRFMIALFSILGDFIYCIFETKCILGSLISCGVMLSLTSFLLLKLLWFRGSFRNKIVQRCRVRSCLWTRRKVLWLHSGLSRSEYVLDALQSSMNARANWGKKAYERTEGMFSIIAAVSELLGKRLSCPTR